MRYASAIIKAVCLILISILFVLFLLFASSFGSDENMADLAMSNVLVSAMILTKIRLCIQNADLLPMLHLKF